MKTKRMATVVMLLTALGLLLATSSVGAVPPTRDGRVTDPSAASRVATSNTVWRIEEVDSGHVGWHSSLVLDSAGWPHIAYFDQGQDDLKYAYKDEGGWHIETVEGAGYVGKFPSLALGSGDLPAISYCSCTAEHCQTCDDLKFAWHDGTDWNIYWADTTGNVGEFNSLAVVADRPHISYYDRTNHDLKYVYLDGSGIPHWATVDSASPDVGRYTSLAVDAGHRFISYVDVTNQHLKYAHYDGSTWNVSTLDNSANTGFYSSLDLCKTYSPGAPRIAYWSNGELKYAHKFFFGGWTFATLSSDPPDAISLALDPLCRPQISYYEEYNYDLKYMAQGTYGWTTETVATNVVDPCYGCYETSLAVDSDYLPHIAFFDESHYGLSYAYKVYVAYLPLVTRH
jgi:hypothetical protein